jgi:hypothetical protein
MNIVIGLAAGLAIAAVAWILLPSRKWPSPHQFRDIYNDGYDHGVETAVELVERLAKLSDDPDQALRHAALIKQLKRGEDEPRT